MKVNQKIYSLFVIIFSIITITMAVLYFQHVVGADIVMLFLGLTELFLGLNQINVSKSMESKKVNKVSKSVGIFCVILGLAIIGAILIRIAI